MVVKDDERMAVAKALRERTKRPIGKSMQLMFSETLGLYREHPDWEHPKKETETWANIVNYLADLIDRPTCRNEDGFGRSFSCSACGYSAWTYGDSCCDPGDFSFCPNCGRGVVDSDD